MELGTLGQDHNPQVIPNLLVILPIGNCKKSWSIVEMIPFDANSI